MKLILKEEKHLKNMQFGLYSDIYMVKKQNGILIAC